MQDIRMIRCFQLNCRGALAVMEELGQVMCERRCLFSLVQEPYTSGGIVRGIPGWFRSFVDSSGDSAILVSDPGVTVGSALSGEHGVCVYAEGVFGRIYLASVYCRFGRSLGPYLDFMDAVLRHVGDSPVIFGVDANAVSSAWFSKVHARASAYPSFARGVEFSEWLLGRGLSVLNRPSELYTFDGPNGVSDIDVTVVNRAALEQLGFGWRVCDDWGVSDHNPIEINVSHVEYPVVDGGVRRWRQRSIDWTHYGGCFREAALSMDIAVFRGLAVDEQVRKLNEWLCSVNDSLLGRHRSVVPATTRWWTHELSVLRRGVRRLRRNFQRSRRGNPDGDLRLKEEYHRALREYRERIVAVKEEEWRNFVRENRDDPWGRVYRIFRGRRAGADVTRLDVDGVAYSGWKDCAEELLRNFFPLAESDGLDVRGGFDAASPGLENSELLESVAKVRCRRSPGVDGMTGEMCRSIWAAVPEYLEALFGKCVAEGYFPAAWKTARVVVLLKSPDKVRSNPRSYRGISLLPVLGKVLERIMVSRLREVYSVGMDDRQFGFREGKGVEDAWAYVRSCVAGSTAKYVLGIFVDFKGAFDYLSWDSVLDRLREVGCRELGLWSSYFQGRRACVVSGCDVVWRSVSRGCPQGSICGPFVWNFMMDVLLRRLAVSFGVCAYADDLLILVEGDTRVVLEERGAEAMRLVYEWGREVGVGVAMDKTVTMLLRGRFHRERPPIVVAGGSRLRYVKEVKYLGISMKERFNFMVHMERVSEKLTGIMAGVRRILRSDWGLCRRAVRVIYGGLFLACATFGASVWCDAVCCDSGRNRILKCQRIGLLACLPVCRTVSTEALQVLLGVAPLDLEVLRRGITFRFKRGLPIRQDWISSSDLARLDVAGVASLLDSEVLRRWQERWTDGELGRVTFGFIPDVTFAVDRKDFGFSMSLGFLLTGHGSLNSFLFRRRLSGTAACRCGAGVEDWRHVLVECSRYSPFRDLSAMGVVVEGDSVDVSRALLSADTLRSISVFARRAFQVRGAN